MYDKGKKSLIRFPPKKKDYVFPLTLITICEQAFQAQRTFTSMVIPNTVKNIQLGILFTTLITTVKFEKGSTLDRLVTNAFGYTNLESIYLPASLKYIETRAFGNSFSLKYIIFEENCLLDYIEGNAFYRCDLRNFSFPSKTTTVLSNVFNQNLNVERIHIPATLVNLDPDAFKGCSGIKEITVDDDNPIFFCKSTSNIDK